MNKKQNSSSLASIPCAMCVTISENEGHVLVHSKRWEWSSQSCKIDFTAVLLEED